MRANAVVRIEGVTAGKRQPEAVYDTLGEGVKRVAIESRCKFEPAALSDPCLQIIARVHLEGDCKDALGITTSTGAQQEVRPLGEHLGFAGARARSQGKISLDFLRRKQGMRFELEVVRRRPCVSFDHSGKASRSLATRANNRSSTSGMSSRSSWSCRLAIA